MAQRYGERGGGWPVISDRHDIDHNTRATNGTAVYPKGRLRKANLIPSPHVYASHVLLVTDMPLKPHLYVVGLLISHTFYCVPLVYTAMPPRVRQCTECTAIRVVKSHVFI